jgi:hypothetical protein
MSCNNYKRTLKTIKYIIKYRELHKDVYIILTYIFFYDILLFIVLKTKLNLHLETVLILLLVITMILISSIINLVAKTIKQNKKE